MESVGPAGRQISVIVSSETVSRLKDWQALAKSIIAADTEVLSEATEHADTNDASNRADWSAADRANLASAKAYTEQADAANRTAWRAADAVDRTAWLAADAADRAVAEQYTDTRTQAVLDTINTSNIGIDTDGSPFIHFGSMTAAVLQDTDGTPYYKPRS